MNSFKIYYTVVRSHGLDIYIAIQMSFKGIVWIEKKKSKDQNELCKIVQFL